MSARSACFVRAVSAAVLAFVMLAVLGCASAPVPSVQTENTAADTAADTEAPANITDEITEEITEETVLAIYDGPKTMKPSDAAKITA